MLWIELVHCCLVRHVRYYLLFAQLPSLLPTKVRIYSGALPLHANSIVLPPLGRQDGGDGSLEQDDLERGGEKNDQPFDARHAGILA